MNRRVLMLLVLLPALAGCRWDLFARRPIPATAAPVMSAEATVEEIVNHLNGRVSRLRSWRCGDTKVHMRMPGLPMPQRLSGSLACEAPGRFRLVAGNVVGVHADLGANEEQGWVYVRPGESMVLTWRHEDAWMLTELMPGFPQLDPAWLLQLLGLEPLRSEDYELEASPEGTQELWLSGSTGGLAGVHRQQLRLDRVLGEVREQLLFGSNDEVLVRAYLSDYQGPPGEKLPHQLRLTFPQTDTVLTLTLGRIEVNPTMSGNLWQPPSGGTAQMVDLRDLQRWSEQQRAGRGRIAGVSQEGGEFESAMLEGELPAVGAVTPLGEGRGVVGGSTSDISAVPDFDVPRRRRWYWPWQR
ncbi:MAG: hypothetical protein ACKOEO_12825 [Planctomycetaceae bacterium]